MKLMVGAKGACSPWRKRESAPAVSISARSFAPRLAPGLRIGDVVAATWAKGGVRGFFAGNMADVIRTAPQKSVQLASCAPPRQPAARARCIPAIRMR